MISKPSIALLFLALTSSVNAAAIAPGGRPFARDVSPGPNMHLRPTTEAPLSLRAAAPTPAVVKRFHGGKSHKSGKSHPGANKSAHATTPASSPASSPAPTLASESSSALGPVPSSSSPASPASAVPSSPASSASAPVTPSASPTTTDSALPSVLSPAPTTNSASTTTTAFVPNSSGE
ncbi:hypothetical protein V8E52_003015 [Russula decolorans]